MLTERHVFSPLTLMPVTFAASSSKRKRWKFVEVALLWVLPLRDGHSHMIERLRWQLSTGIFLNVMIKNEGVFKERRLHELFAWVRFLSGN